MSDAEIQGRSITIRRELPFPPERVFAAFTTPEALRAWWGPEGFETITTSFELREGGSWHYDMIHPEHGRFPNHVRFTAVEPGRRIAYESLGDGEVVFRSEIQLRRRSTGTEVSLNLTFPSEEALRQVVEEHHAIEGGRGTLRRLAQLLGDPGGSLSTHAVGTHEIVMSRTFPASVERVWRAHTDPEQLKRWLGTPGNDMTRCEVDLREGGTFRYEWGEMGLSGTFVRIEPYLRLDTTERFDDDWTHGEGHITTWFVDVGGQTTVLLRLRYASEAVRDAVLDSPMPQGMEDTYANLAEHLVDDALGLGDLDPKLDLVLDRVIDVPAHLVWRAWTEPELLVQWFTPAPWSTASCELDVRPGGLFRTVMRSPEGEEMPSDGCYLAVEPLRRLVWTDALGAGYRPNGSAFMTATLHLVPVGSGGTRYVAVVRHANEEACKQHAEMGFLDGWGAALDQLVALMRPE